MSETKTYIQLLAKLLQFALRKGGEVPYLPTAKEWTKVYEESERQAIVGVMLYGLQQLIERDFSFKTNLPQGLMLQWIGVGEMIRQRNIVMDRAVVDLCKALEENNIKYIVVKGQTLNAIYPERNIRQSGDIDFMVHPHDWKKCYKMFDRKLGESSIDTHSEKHVEWEKDGISYEMHRWLNDFASKKHQKYWDEVVMKEAWDNISTIDINGFSIATLPPTYNALYVFLHLFYHLINEGVGLRQFIDWFYILEKGVQINKDVLKRHLEGIGLFEAYCGLGAVLTCYLGLEEDRFLFEISEKYKKEAYKLVDNIFEGGNFGHNKQYVQPHGVIHGLQQFGQVFKQCVKFGHYAPSESWGYLWIKVVWWGKKLKRMLVKRS